MHIILDYKVSNKYRQVFISVIVLESLAEVSDELVMLGLCCPFPAAEVTALLADMRFCCFKTDACLWLTCPWLLSSDVVPRGIWTSTEPIQEYWIQHITFAAETNVACSCGWVDTDTHTL